LFVLAFTDRLLFSVQAGIVGLVAAGNTKIGICDGKCSILAIVVDFAFQRHWRCDDGSAMA
jgi:hypothetical protein